MQVMEQKGLDIVRRDWCGLSKEAGHAVLRAVLSCRPCEEVVEIIHQQLRCVCVCAEGGGHALCQASVCFAGLFDRPE
jgi:DNA polymerase alpha subunit A